jgi:hypothetical protein
MQAQPEQVPTPAMIVTTTENIPDTRVVKTIGQVFGAECCRHGGQRRDHDALRLHGNGRRYDRDRGLWHCSGDRVGPHNPRAMRPAR